MAENNGANQLQINPGDVFLLVKLVNGQITVSGVISDKGLAYMMLEMAKDAVRDYVAKQSSLVMPATRLPGENNL